MQFYLQFKLFQFRFEFIHDSEFFSRDKQTMNNWCVLARQFHDVEQCNSACRTWNLWNFVVAAAVVPRFHSSDRSACQRCSRIQLPRLMDNICGYCCLTTTTITAAWPPTYISLPIVIGIQEIFRASFMNSRSLY